MAIITSEKIKVTEQMMSNAEMTRGSQLGVPDGKGSLIWKEMSEMTDTDFDAIEDYFLKKSEK